MLWHLSIYLGTHRHVLQQLFQYTLAPTSICFGASVGYYLHPPRFSLPGGTGTDLTLNWHVSSSCSTYICYKLCQCQLDRSVSKLNGAICLSNFSVVNAVMKSCTELLHTVQSTIIHSVRCFREFIQESLRIRRCMNKVMLTDSVQADYYILFRKL